ncbi:MAG: glutamine synthetase [Porticoccaceae bacterium]|jgi:glutamine synthetase|nr:glutamine synthetase [SAR92 clade bacterium]MDE0875301.1 glutamine synthetase [Porticoccaceae bacterium]|tara:strand:+ start:532 stop:1542 length:1011 start_codon:yes stop_codon:yes gene_type:complete
MKAKLEYIWLDGTAPTQCLRSKTQVRHDFGGTLEECPMWCFDGSSTNQAEGNASDCLLKPVAIYPDPDRSNAFLVMTEVMNADGTPHATNGRATINDDDNDFWFGFEQEYFLWDVDTQLPPGFPHGGFPAPQGPYYCSVGAANTFGRDCVEEHFDICLEAGLNVEGINAEVAAGQWEFQCFAKGAKQAGDEIWVSRYLLERTGEKYGYAINYHPKPLGDTDWNGSGMHANFSNGAMRDLGDETVFTKICEEFGKNIERHISVYGADNDQRLTGKHETQSINEFSYGVSDRGASIRIPIGTVEDGWKGRLEDRRTSSNADPYKVAAAIIKTTKEALA